MNMNAKMKKGSLLVAVLLLIGGSLFVLPSCNDTLDIKSTRVAGEQNHWESLDDVRSGLIGIYGLLRAALANENGYWLRGDLRRGDFTAYSRPDLKAIIDGELNASYPVIKDLSNWRRFYAVVNAANLFIENAHKALDDKRYTKLNYTVDIAQARSLRAFAYFLMVRVWGDVPLILHSPGGQFKELKRTPKEQVLAFAEKELRAAAPDLPYVYGSDDPQMPGNYYGYGHSRFVNTLITKLAAYAMLAHIAAWQAHYLDVAVYTDFILKNFEKEGMTYVTTEDLTKPDGLFANRKANQLIGFNYVQGHGEATTNGHIEDLTLASPYIFRRYPEIYVSKDSIASIFPASNGNDQRFGIDTLSGLPRTAYFTNYRGEIPVFSKIKVLAQGNSSNFSVYSSVLVFTRLEELTLLRAEALAVLANNDAGNASEAIRLLNIIKDKRTVKAYVAGESGDLIDAIFAERRRELMGEGWRWWDRVRYNRIKRNNSLFNELIDEGGIYWPVAEDVLNRNANITQNPYWQGK